MTTEEKNSGRACPVCGEPAAFSQRDNNDKIEAMLSFADNENLNLGSHAVGAFDGFYEEYNILSPDNPGC